MPRHRVNLPADRTGIVAVRWGKASPDTYGDANVRVAVESDEPDGRPGYTDYRTEAEDSAVLSLREVNELIQTLERARDQAFVNPRE